MLASTGGLENFVLICCHMPQNCDKKTVCSSSSFRMGLAISLVSDVKEKVQYVTCSLNCIMFKVKKKKKR